MKKERKKRGLGRYYRNLNHQNDFDRITWLNLRDPDEWFDNWHLHFDWYGYGNNSFKRRKPHLDKLFRHFELLAEEVKVMNQDFHLYAIIFDRSSSDDALYLHTKNPNSDNFPLKIETSLSAVSSIGNPHLIKYLDKLIGYRILYYSGDENCCFITRDGVGLEISYLST